MYIYIYSSNRLLEDISDVPNRRGEDFGDMSINIAKKKPKPKNLTFADNSVLIANRVIGY